MANLGIDFEYMLRRFLGEKAFGRAGFEQNDGSFRKCLQDITPVLRRQIKYLDTTERHKKMLLNEVEGLHDLLKVRGGGTEKQMIIKLYSLVARLFGFYSIDGIVRWQPFYHQTLSEHFWEEDKDHEARENHWRNIYAHQDKIYMELREQGLSDQIIAGILNTTEYQIKKRYKVDVMRNKSKIST